MRDWLCGGLSALMLMAAAGTVAAQEAEAPLNLLTIAEDRTAVDDIARQLDAGLQAMALEIGIEVPSVRPIFTALISDTFKDLPEGDDYAFNAGFDFNSVRTDRPLPEGADERRAPYADAGACAAGQALSVFRFERLDIDGLTGHRCLLVGQAPEDPDSWVFLSTVILVGRDRHVDIRVAAAAVSGEGGFARAAEVGSSQLEGLIGLAAGIDQMVIDVVLAVKIAE